MIKELDQFPEWASKFNRNSINIETIDSRTTFTTPTISGLYQFWKSLSPRSMLVDDLQENFTKEHFEIVDDVKSQYIQGIEKRELEWTPEMRSQYLDLFLKYGRNFRSIAKELNISVSQAITFYYDFKYSDEFREVIASVKRGPPNNVNYMRIRNGDKSNRISNGVSEHITREMRGKKKGTSDSTSSVASISASSQFPSTEKNVPLVERILAMKVVSRMTNMKYESYVDDTFTFLKKIRFLVKWKDRSYLHSDWVPVQFILLQQMGDKKIQKFLHEYDMKSFVRMQKNSQYFPKQYQTIERILSIDQENDQCLVKWNCLDYSECTFEKLSFLRETCSGLSKQIDEYKNREAMYHSRGDFGKIPCKVFQTAPKSIPKLKYPKIIGTHNSKIFQEPDTSLVYKIERNIQDAIYDYELEMLNWLLVVRKKALPGAMLSSLVPTDFDSFHRAFTIVEFLKYLRKCEGVNGPHLIVCSPSNIDNWLHEFQLELPDLNTISFSGNDQSCEIVYNYEFWSDGEDPCPKFDILLTTYDVCVNHQNLLQDFYFQVAIVDGAPIWREQEHELLTCISDFEPAFKLILASNPPRSNAREWFYLLNFIDPDEFRNETHFLEVYRKFEDIEKLCDDEMISKYICILTHKNFSVDENDLLPNALDDGSPYKMIQPLNGESNVLYKQFIDELSRVSQPSNEARVEKKKRNTTNTEGKSRKRRKIEVPVESKQTKKNDVVEINLINRASPDDVILTAIIEPNSLDECHRSLNEKNVFPQSSMEVAIEPQHPTLDVPSREPKPIKRTIHHPPPQIQQTQIPPPPHQHAQSSHPSSFQSQLPNPMQSTPPIPQRHPSSVSYYQNSITIHPTYSSGTQHHIHHPHPSQSRPLHMQSSHAIAHSHMQPSQHPISSHFSTPQQHIHPTVPTSRSSMPHQVTMQTSQSRMHMHSLNQQMRYHSPSSPMYMTKAVPSTMYVYEKTPSNVYNNGLDMHPTHFYGNSQSSTDEHTPLPSVNDLMRKRW